MQVALTLLPEQHCYSVHASSYVLLAMQAPVLVLAAGACVGVALLLFRRRAKKHIEGGDLTIAAMAEQWRQDLLENVVPFWERVSIDSECGGFFTAVDRDGTLLDHSKYAWLQSRAVYM